MVNEESIGNSEINPAAEAWDMSDVESQFNGDTFRIPETNTSKTEEERTYETRERLLKDELFNISDRRANYIADTGDTFIQALREIEHPLTGSLESKVDDIVSGKKSTGRATLESLFGYINAMYPSPYSEEFRDPKKVDDAATVFRSTSFREGSYTGDTVDSVAQDFRSDGSDRDLYIASDLNKIGEDSANYHSALAEAIIAYAEDPSKNNRARITNVQFDHSGAMSRSLYDIAEQFDRSRTSVGRKMFDPTMSLMQNLTTNTEDYFDGIMEYLKFKMENNPEDSGFENNSDKEPDVYLA